MTEKFNQFGMTDQEFDDFLKELSVNDLSDVRCLTMAAIESCDREIAAAIERFRDCGVEIERFSIVTVRADGAIHLCVDGVSRFSWRLGKLGPQP